MNKATMILYICGMLNIKYIPSMHNMKLDELERLYDGLVNIGCKLEPR